MSMESEQEEVRLQVVEEDEVVLSGSQMTATSTTVVQIASPTEEPTDDTLAFIDVSGRGIDEIAADGEPKAVAGGERPTVWQRVRVNWDAAKAAKTSMTADLAPWTAFSDRSKFSVPQKSEVFGRVRTNLKIFYANYMMLLGGLAIYIMISNLVFVLAMMLSVGSYYYYRIMTSDGSAFVFRGRQISPPQFYVGLVSLTLFLFWITGGGSTMFWMIITALFVVFGHASFREAEIDSNTNADIAFNAFVASRV